jgi:hypothetical protein
VSAEYTEKYVVTKVGSDEPLLEGTYFVIRSKDVFATSALYAYAQSIQTILDAQHDLGIELDSEVADNLHQLADQLLDKARDWESLNRKVPD